MPSHHSERRPEMTLAVRVLSVVHRAELHDRRAKKWTEHLKELNQHFTH